MLLTTEVTVPLPTVPRLRPLIWLNVSLGALSAVGIFLPMELAVTLKGVVGSDGPTTLVSAPTEGIVLQVPRESSKYTKGKPLFQLQLPLVQEDLEARRRQFLDLQNRLSESNSACSYSLKAAENKLKDAKEMYRMNNDAYNEKAISRMQLYQNRSLLSQSIRDLEDTRSRCRQEQSQLRSETSAAQDHLRRSQITKQFLSVLTAPDDGTVFTIAVRKGQRVQAGEELARFARSDSSIAELRLTAADRPFIHLGRPLSVSSPSYSFMQSPPIRTCVVDTITPELISTTIASGGIKSQSYLLRCRFRESPADGPYPLVNGMDIIARTAGLKVTPFQLMLKGYRSSVLER